jgi:endonuclease/exonuclease/phosphatase family metal-dependent hydrolase
MIIITLNAGLFQMSFLGYTLSEPTPYLKERLQALPVALVDSNADIIALQEIFKKEHRKYLISKLQHSYPYYASYNRSFSLRFNNGLMIFSKFPILSSNFDPFIKSPIDEKILFQKGILRATVLTDRLGKISLFNIHTTFGGIFSPQDTTRINNFRSIQIQQVIKLSQDCNDSIPLILGDFNAGPEISNINYQYFLERDFVDLFEFCNRDRNDNQKNGDQVTWHPKNPLNEKGMFSTSPPQRIDHIFVPSKFVPFFKNSEVKIIFENPLVNLLDQKTVTLSDHYGLKVELA